MMASTTYASMTIPSHFQRDVMARNLKRAYQWWLDSETIDERVARMIRNGAPADLLMEQTR